MHRIFVYGTLRRGGVRAIEVHFPPAEFVASAHVSGILYDLGPYPGLRLDGEQPVTGEIYQVDDAVLEALDAYEGFNPIEPELSEYQRRSVAAFLADGLSLDCHVYEMQFARTTGCSAVAGGDWIAYIESRDS